MSVKPIGKYIYSRGRSKPDVGSIVKLIDSEGNFNIFKLGATEPIGSLAVQCTTPVDAIPAGVASEPAEFRFTEPAQEGRLFHFRPYIFAVRRLDQLPDGRLLFADIPDEVIIPPLQINPATDFIPMGAALQLEHPSGTKRWGTDRKFDVTVTTPGGVVITTAGVGGVDGGFLEAPLVPFIDDLSDLWDVYTIFGHTVSFRMVNRSNFYWPPGWPMGGGTDRKDYFIGLIGSKFTLLEVKESIKAKVANCEIEYEPIVIGGIPSVSTKA